MYFHIKNKQAFFNYTIFDTFEAGIALTGGEVKSIRLGKVDITSSYVHVTKKMEVELLNCIVQKYPFTTLAAPKHDQYRPKKLLLHAKEIKKIAGKIQTAGFSMVPLSLYINKRGKVKLTIALAKGKKLHDKRQTLKERDIAKQSKQIEKHKYS